MAPLHSAARRPVNDKTIHPVCHESATVSLAPSIIFQRTYLAVLAIFWTFALLKTIMVPELLNGWPVRLLILRAALVLFTSASFFVAIRLIRSIRLYEATRDTERLLFLNARDAMLLVRVHRNPVGQSASFSFVIEAENPAAVERLSAFGQETTYVGCTIDEVFPDWLKERVRFEYTACATSCQERRYEISPPAGEFTHESIATPVLDATGSHVTHIIVIMRDIGERIRHERELADALRRAEAANKSKSHFLASMSHELRTPLNAILGYSEMLSLSIGGTLSDKHKEYAQHIHLSGNHLLKIIGDILDLSKIKAGHYVLHDEETSISPLIETCVSMVRELAASKGVILHTEGPSYLPLMRVDPLRLKQVVLNLLSNAIKFTDNGGVTLTVEADEAHGLTLAVSDTGIGMTEEEMIVALEPFGQVESAFARSHDGTGLGLPIARHLVELHGGQLSLASCKGVGTTVSITIPADRLVRRSAA